MKAKTYLIALALFLLAAIPSCSKIMPERNIDYNAGRVPVSVPRGLRNAEKDAGMDRETAVIVSLPSNDEIYVGKERIASAKEDLSFKLRQLLKDQTDSEKRVYVAAGVMNEWASVVWICNEIKKQNVSRVGLLAINAENNSPGRITVELAPPDPNDGVGKEDIRVEIRRPNPLTLVVSISPDLKLRLNQDDMGSVNDSAPLSVRLEQTFRYRKEIRAYKPGSETRTDLTEDERVEKTVTVKAPRSLKYGEVMKVIDAIKGAGASPIVLQLDDLAQ
jgi:biopolymer transport protein ExbD